jgi:hypothetical protein
VNPGWCMGISAKEGGLCIDCVRSCEDGVKVECRKRH